MRLRIRMYRDLSVLWFREHWPFVISVLLLVQSLLLFVFPLAALLTGVATVLSIMIFIREAWTNRREARAQFVEQRRDPATSSLEPPSAWTDGELHEVRDQTYLTSDLADRFVRKGSLRLEYSAITHTLPAFVAQVVPAVVSARRRSGSLVFDGSVLRLDNDPATSVSESSTLVARPTKYFNALATNYLCGHQVVSRGHRRVIMTGWEFAVDRRGYVRDLDQSWSANHVGVSTLAFTLDRQVLLVQQSAENVSERDRLAPSGSGSAEPQDVSPGAELLNSLLVRAMERELREECNLAHARMRTRVLGYSRWIDHGAKPEFYGITAVGIDERSLLGVGVARKERALVSRVRTVLLDIDHVRATADSGGPAALEALIDGAVSTPLIMCLRALAEALREEPTLVDDLFAEVDQASE